MPTTPVIKVFVTHRGAARAKYGPAGWMKIRHAVTALIKADKARGISTRLVALDSATELKPLGATPITAASDVTGIKNAIARIYQAWHPAYLVLFGGPELLGTVNLTNPLWTGDPNDDPDQFIPSDLPYACDGPLTFSPTDYRAPTRVVGRIADLVGDSDPTVLLLQLSLAAQGKSLSRTSPQPVLAVSAKVWQVSTQMSIKALPDVFGAVRTSPPDGPSWARADTAPAVHFVNCHGGEFDPNWYGQASPNNWNLPTAIGAAGLPGLVAHGTVVAVECCYGTSHWPPSAAHGQASVAMTYLQQGAAGVFGASTVAYGPAASNNYADVLCRMFVAEVLGGASLGRAVLAARQQFVQSQSFLDPTDLKTLAQFNLLGDPAAVPFVAAALSGAKVRRSLMVSSPAATSEVLIRRGRFDAIGAALGRSTFVCADQPRAKAGITRKSLSDLLGRTLPPGVTIRTFDATTDDADTVELFTTQVHRATIKPRAHLAFVSGQARQPASLVIVREHDGGEPEVRVVVRR